ncbi:MAG: hypothetical protein ACK5YC_01525 [Planctomyces sp.]
MSRKFRIQQARLVGVSLVMALCSGLFGQQSSVVSEQAYGLEVNSESSGLLQSPDTESVTEQRLAELEEMVRELREKSAKKTLPSVTINGVFQADVGWIQQDLASRQKYGDIQDGADFRRARLSAKGSITETNNYFFQMDF